MKKKVDQIGVYYNFLLYFSSATFATSYPYITTGQMSSKIACKLHKELETQVILLAVKAKVSYYRNENITRYLVKSKTDHLGNNLSA